MSTPNKQDVKVEPKKKGGKKSTNDDKSIKVEKETKKKTSNAIKKEKTGSPQIFEVKKEPKK